MLLNANVWLAQVPDVHPCSLLYSKPKVQPWHRGGVEGAARGRTTQDSRATLWGQAEFPSGQHSPHCCEGAPMGPVAARGLCTALRASDSIKHRLRTEGPRNHREPSASLFLSAFPVTQHPIWCHFSFYGNWQVQLWVEGFRYKVYFFKL